MADLGVAHGRYGWFSHHQRAKWEWPKPPALGVALPPPFGLGVGLATPNGQTLNFLFFSLALWGWPNHPKGPNPKLFFFFFFFFIFFLWPCGGGPKAFWGGFGHPHVSQSHPSFFFFFLKKISIRHRTRVTFLKMLTWTSVNFFTEIE
jgi:hypothetical protein